MDNVEAWLKGNSDRLKGCEEFLDAKKTPFLRIPEGEGKTPGSIAGGLPFLFTGVNRDDTLHNCGCRVQKHGSYPTKTVRIFH